MVILKFIMFLNLLTQKHRNPVFWDDFVHHDWDERNNQEHSYHIVETSPWPFFISLWLPLLILQFVNFLHNSVFFDQKNVFLLFSIFIFLIIIGCWFIDIIHEGTYEGFHTKTVQQSLRFGFILSIISEIILFFSFFWAFFYNFLNPSIFIGNVWPPLGINPLETWNIPFLNTIILLCSGITLTWSHLILVNSHTSQLAETSPINLKELIFKYSLIGLFITIRYGSLFSFLQRFEYIVADFTIADGIYGSTFFILTGLHGSHVLIGTIFLIIQFVRIVKHHHLTTHHVGFEASIWYWHFVDIIWLFVFIIIYFWSNY